MSEWQRIQIYEELAHSGVEFEVINPASFPSLAQCNEELVRRLREDKSIDVFLSCLPDEFFLPGIIEQISRLPIPKVLVQFDNLHAPYKNKQTAKYFDLVWITSWETEHMFKSWGCKTIFLPYAANPFLYKDLYSAPIGRVCFVGTPYGSRTQFINELVSAEVGFDLFYNASRRQIGQRVSLPYKVYEKSMLQAFFRDITFPIGRSVIAGKLMTMIRRSAKLDETNTFLSWKDSLSFEAMNEAYSNYALSLNVIALRNTYSLRHPVQKLHLRTFEIPMSSGLELVSYNDELASYFSDDEMVFFKDKEEMIDKARFYSQERQQSLCRKMKVNARKKAIKEHTWTARFRVLFHEIGLNF